MLVPEHPLGPTLVNRSKNHVDIQFRCLKCKFWRHSGQTRATEQPFVHSGAWCSSLAASWRISCPPGMISCVHFLSWHTFFSRLSSCPLWSQPVVLTCGVFVCAAPPYDGQAHHRHRRASFHRHSPTPVEHLRECYEQLFLPAQTDDRRCYRFITYNCTSLDHWENPGPPTGACRSVLRFSHAAVHTLPNSGQTGSQVNKTAHTTKHIWTCDVFRL